jgi:hypothetical protein
MKCLHCDGDQFIEKKVLFHPEIEEETVEDTKPALCSQKR